jgi:hypothetical protein
MRPVLFDIDLDIIANWFIIRQLRRWRYPSMSAWTAVGVGPGIANKTWIVAEVWTSGCSLFPAWSLRLRCDWLDLMIVAKE